MKRIDVYLCDNAGNLTFLATVDDRAGAMTELMRDFAISWCLAWDGATYMLWREGVAGAYRVN